MNMSKQYVTKNHFNVSYESSNEYKGYKLCVFQMEGDDITYFENGTIYPDIETAQKLCLKRGYIEEYIPKSEMWVVFYTKNVRREYFILWKK